MNIKNKVELLAPAGNLEKLKVALHYGADALYGGPADFSLRAGGGVFLFDQLKKAIEFTHSKSAKFYMTFNTFLRENELDDFARLLEKAAALNPDAFIISDPGGIAIASKVAPQIPIHLSTQGNNLNSAALNLWKGHGVSRVILARELSLSEISNIKQNTDVELECFIHGALCISFSGRCMLSLYYTGRDANKGDCTHPCRWSYELIETSRPTQPFLVEEDKHGTYFFNSKDLCSIEFIPELLKTGVSSLKIEGRMKTANYLASVVSIYRDAIDLYYEKLDNFETKQVWIDELEKVNTRGYTKGFFYPEDRNNQPEQYNKNGPTANRYLGFVLKDLGAGEYLILVKNSFDEGETVEVFGKGVSVRKEKITSLTDFDKQPIPRAHPGKKVIAKLAGRIEEMDLLRHPADKASSSS